ncbi:MAG: SprB repeat-containing protein [Chitinophagaceae bacterium]|nr:SprB repeat-containing protein [Chitinophagaceae bacterium]
MYTKNDDPAAEVFGVDTVRISRVNAITANTATTSTLCNGATDGTVTVTPLSGTSPFSFSLDGAPPVSVPGAHTFTNVPAGSHTITMSDANGCPSSASVTVAAGPGLITTASKTDVLCKGYATGTITVAQPSLGTPPFEYSLDGTNWQTSNVFNNVSAGTYTVHFRSADICPGTTAITVSEPALLDAISVNQNGTCDGGADGTITVTAAGGSPGYQFSIDGVNFQTSNVFNVLPNASYTVTVKDANGCLKIFNTAVGLSNNLTFTPQTDPTICESKSTQLQIVTNGTQYDWSPRTGLNDTTIYNPVASPVLTTEYIVKITKGLCVDYDTVLVNVNKARYQMLAPTVLSVMVKLTGYRQGMAYSINGHRLLILIILMLLILFPVRPKTWFILCLYWPMLTVVHPLLRMM